MLVLMSKDLVGAHMGQERFDSRSKRITRCKRLGRVSDSAHEQWSHGQMHSCSNSQKYSRFRWLSLHLLDVKASSGAHM